jgi:hypothetical protein
MNFSAMICYLRLVTILASGTSPLRATIMSMTIRRKEQAVNNAAV